MVLVVPPVLHAVQPSLGAFVLAPAVKRAGVSCRVIEANVAFAGRLGFDVAAALAGSLPWRLLGEAVFLAAAFPERAADHARVLRLLNRQEGPGRIGMVFKSLSDDDLLAYAAEVPAFVDDIAQRVLSHGPRIVGFSSMGQQTLASIALARAIKRKRPDVLTVLGGSNPTEPAASGIVAITDVFDHVFSGEADLVFPAFCRDYVRDGKLPAEAVVRCPPLADLDVVPVPEYEAYFEELEPYRASEPMAAQAPHTVLFESSRGCWWGDKHLCTFCGYVTPGTRYRTKSTAQIVEAVRAISTRYGVGRVRASDAIMPSDFTRTVLPALMDQRVPTALAYEIKANQKESDLDTFIRAGVDEVQPGIESLSTHVLQLMSKGISALENVRLLRDARSRDLPLIWNFITAFPGEHAEDYEAMMRLIPLIEHTMAPVRWGAIHVSRYSPYHTAPERYGITNIRPFPVYRELFGDAAERVAHNFDADYASAWDDPDLVARFDATCERWVQAWRPGPPPRLEVRLLDGSLTVRDERAVARAKLYRLSQAEVDALEALRRPCTREQLAEPHRAVLGPLLEHGFVVDYEEQLLSLVTEPEIGERLRADRRALLARPPVTAEPEAAASRRKQLDVV